jgi:hypothetical protein
MIIIDSMMTLFTFMVVVNLLLFLFILGKKINMVSLEKKKEILRENFEDKIKNYLTSRDKTQMIVLSTKLERIVYEELLLNHVPYLPDELKQELTSVLGRDRVVREIERKLLSKNLWVKKIGTFQAGELGVGEVSSALLAQIKQKNRELLYITSRALIKLEGNKYLLAILNEAGKANRMEKNNVLTLVEMIDLDIRDVLDKIMHGSSTFLQILALEIYGKRKYSEGVSWIKIMVSNPSKEIRIAALKGAYALGDIIDNDYFNKIAVLENDEDWEVRAFLARFLEITKTKAAINILTRLIKDSNWDVRNNAASSLSKLGAKGLNSLVGLLDSKDRFAREKSREVIQTGIIYKDIANKMDSETNERDAIPKLENGLKVKGNYEQ